MDLEQHVTLLVNSIALLLHFIHFFHYVFYYGKNICPPKIDEVHEGTGGKARIADESTKARIENEGNE